MTNLTTTATLPGDGPFSVECPNLLQRHLDHLRASSISDEVIKERGYESVLGKSRCAEAIGCSRNLAYSLARRNRLPVPVIKLGQKRICVSRRSVEMLLQGNGPTERLV